MEKPPLPPGERIKVRGKMKFKNHDSFRSLSLFFLLVYFATKIEKNLKS